MWSYMSIQVIYNKNWQTKRKEKNHSWIVHSKRCTTLGLDFLFAQQWVPGSICLCIFPAQGLQDRAHSPRKVSKLPPSDSVLQRYNPVIPFQLSQDLCSCQTFFQIPTWVNSDSETLCSDPLCEFLLILRPTLRKGECSQCLVYLQAESVPLQAYSDLSYPNPTLSTYFYCIISLTVSSYCSLVYFL